MSRFWTSRGLPVCRRVDNENVFAFVDGGRKGAGSSVRFQGLIRRMSVGNRAGSVFSLFSVLAVGSLAACGGSSTSSGPKGNIVLTQAMSKMTVGVVGLQEKLMVARVQFQSGVADLTLEKSEKTAEAHASK